MKYLKLYEEFLNEEKGSLSSYSDYGTSSSNDIKHQTTHQSKDMVYHDPYKKVHNRFSDFELEKLAEEEYHMFGHKRATKKIIFTRPNGMKYFYHPRITLEYKGKKRIYYYFVTFGVHGNVDTLDEALFHINKFLREEEFKIKYK